MDEVLTAIESIHPITKELKEYLLHNLKEQVYKRGAFLLMAGDISRRANFVQKGLLRAFRLVDGKEYTVGFFKEGEVSLASESFENQLPSEEYVQALERTSVIYLSYQEIQYAAQHFSEVALVQSLIFGNAARTYMAHLNRMKMLTPSERYAWLLDSHPELIHRVPAKYIASYLGISQFTLSRIKGKR